MLHAGDGTAPIHSPDRQKNELRQRLHAALVALAALPASDQTRISRDLWALFAPRSPGS